MSTLQVALRENRTAFEPGEEIVGAASWQTPNPPRSVELHLLWYTSGKGTPDTEIVDTHTFSNPGADAIEPFSFRLPTEPYSFSGKLISLQWAVELVVEPGGESTRVEFVMAPGGTEVDITSNESP